MTEDIYETCAAMQRPLEARWDTLAHLKSLGMLCMGS